MQDNSKTGWRINNGKYIIPGNNLRLECHSAADTAITFETQFIVPDLFTETSGELQCAVYMENGNVPFDITTLLALTSAWSVAGAVAGIITSCLV